MTKALEYRPARPGTSLSELKVGDRIYLERVPKAGDSGEVWLVRTRRTHFNVITPFITRFKYVGKSGSQELWEIHTSMGVVYTNTRHRYHKAGR